MSENKDNGNELPLLDRIMSSGETLDCSRREIAEEMRELQRTNDIAGMQSLFNAYKNWEIRNRKPDVSIENTEELAFRNFEIVAKVADEQDNVGHDLIAMARSIQRGNKGGKISRFYRKAVSYEPPKERTDHFYDN